jgi:hypothetical protein
MRMPNFIIIGAAKSGTTSVYRYLQQHPLVYMSPLKETNFFAYEGQTLKFRWWGEPPISILHSITDINAYCAQFRDVSNELAIGEASPLYLYHQTAAARIQHYLPNAKLIAILRHPVERAFSHFTHLIRHNREPLSDFSQALQEEKARMREGWNWDYYYRDMGFYYVQLKRYFDIFARAQIKVFLYEELKTDAKGFMKQIFRFLGIDDAFLPDVSIRYNVSGSPKNKFVQAFLSKWNPIKAIVKSFLPQELRYRLLSQVGNKIFTKPELPLGIRSQLLEGYREDILKLQDLIKRDLSMWLNKRRV